MLALLIKITFLQLHRMMLLRRTLLITMMLSHAHVGLSDLYRHRKHKQILACDVLPYIHPDTYNALERCTTSFEDWVVLEIVRFVR